MIKVILTLYAGCKISVHRMVMEIVLLTLAASRGVTATLFLRIVYRTRANDLP